MPVAAQIQEMKVAAQLGNILILKQICASHAQQVAQIVLD
jgi:hypothetical protein